MGGPAQVGPPGAAGDGDVPEKWPVRHGLAMWAVACPTGPAAGRRPSTGQTTRPAEEPGRRAALGDDVAGQ